jgi:heat shock protein HslJ
VPSQPVIDTFTIVPAQIQAAECVQISWSTSGATWLVRLLRNNVLVLDNANLVGAVQDCLQYPGTYTYQLVASTANGQSISRDQSVRVSEAPQVNPFAGRSFAVTAVNNSATLPGSAVTISFSAEGQVTGSGGCNNYNGRYSVTGAERNGQISVSELSSTNQMCGEPPGLMTQETDYFNAMRAAATYEFVTDDIVIFRNAAGQEVVRLGPVIQPR